MGSGGVLFLAGTSLRSRDGSDEIVSIWSARALAEIVSTGACRKWGRGLQSILVLRGGRGREQVCDEARHDGGLYFEGRGLKSVWRDCGKSESSRDE